jgi:cytochrome c peroxidase
MLRVTATVRALCAAALLSIGLFEKQAIAEGHYGPHDRGYGLVHQVTPAARNLAVGWRPDNLLVSLGQRLFFDARLSGTGAKACASCHSPGYAYAEPRWVSINDNGKLGRRNAPSLLDVAFLPRLMWDGSFHTLEQQALGPFQRGEMGIGVEQAVARVNSDPQYLHLFRAALGGFATPDGLGRALASFQRTLVTQESRVDRFLASKDPAALSPLERNGYEIFTRRAGCANCHHLFPLMPDGRQSSRALLSDFQFHNLGVGYKAGRYDDEGRFELSRLPNEWGAFRTPSLRNSAKSPPYMHDGSFATLEEVVEFYNGGARPNPNLSPLIRPLHLAAYEKAALVAFLRALSD